MEKKYYSELNSATVRVNTKDYTSLKDLASKSGMSMGEALHTLLQEGNKANLSDVTPQQIPTAIMLDVQSKCTSIESILKQVQTGITLEQSQSLTDSMSQETWLEIGEKKGFANTCNECKAEEFKKQAEIAENKLVTIRKILSDEITGPAMAKLIIERALSELGSFELEKGVRLIVKS